MCEPPETDVNDVVELYKAKISAALDGMSPEDIRALVQEIESHIAGLID
jgi:hypothetical protein